MMVRREHQDHFRDCYFCLTNLQGFTSRKSKQHIRYPIKVLSVILPVPHSAEIPISLVPRDQDEISGIIENRIGNIFGYFWVGK